MSHNRCNGSFTPWSIVFILKPAQVSMSVCRVVLRNPLSKTQRTLEGFCSLFVVHERKIIHGVFTTVPVRRLNRKRCNFYTPRFNEVERGYTGFTLSVHPSVCGQNRVRSVSSAILVGSISYLHIFSSNFRKCVACKGCFKIRKFVISANSLCM